MHFSSCRTQAKQRPFQCWHRQSQMDVHSEAARAVVDGVACQLSGNGSVQHVAVPFSSLHNTATQEVCAASKLLLGESGVV